jgi:hypothetical protein
LELRLVVSKAISLRIISMLCGWDATMGLLSVDLWLLGSQHNV